MGLQKYRTDYYRPQQDGAILWFADWIGGPTLTKINKCRWKNMEGDPRVTVYIQDDADTAWTIPAACYYKNCRINGYLTSDDDGNCVFRHTYF